MRKITSLILVLLLTFSLTACGGSNYATVSAIRLSDGFESNVEEYDYYDRSFTLSQNKMALEVFAAASQSNTDRNVLISPVSLTSILGMLANGADNETLNEIVALLGDNSEATNHNIYSFWNSVPKSSKITNTNSVWIKDDNNFSVKNSFLQANANFYGADIFKMPFDEKAADEINGWVNNATKGEINSIVNEIDKHTCLYLINALTLDAEWHTPYAKSDIKSGKFNSPDGTTTVEMMTAKENYYINAGNATGFIKEYKNGDYRFVALLPNEGLDINEYINTLKSDSIASIVEKAMERNVTSVMPKFSSAFEISFDDTLKSLGITAAFDEDKADFTKLGSYKNANLYLANVMQKTYISVDEKGTKAGAVTKAEIGVKTSLEEMPVTVTLDRPFVYAIIEAKSNVPLFIGKVIKP